MSDADLVDLQVIAKYGGYGVDANGDNEADPWNLEDAVYAAAKYLAANGASNGDYYNAVYAYNHADWYVTMVLELAGKYVINSSSDLGVEYSGNAVADVGIIWIGRSTYVFGGGRTEADVAAGIFDCSSFVYWCFEQNGVILGSRGGVNTDTLKLLGVRVSIEDAQPGDLVFFDTYKIDGHVCIYMGNGKAIGCQTGTGVGIIDMSSDYYTRTFSGHVRRIT